MSASINAATVFEFSATCTNSAEQFANIPIQSPFGDNPCQQIYGLDDGGLITSSGVLSLDIDQLLGTTIDASDLLFVQFDNSPVGGFSFEQTANGFLASPDPASLLLEYTSTSDANGDLVSSSSTVFLAATGDTTTSTIFNGLLNVTIQLANGLVVGANGIGINPQLTLSSVQVPEPGSLALTALALAGIAMRKRRVR